MLSYMAHTVINLTRNVTLAKAARMADDPISRLIGLLGRSALPAHGGLILRPCSGVHMLGMRFAVDALYVDAKGRVVRAISALRPWRIGPVDPRADAVIELPVGTLATTQTAIGDEIAIRHAVG
jgi:uncharacterized protein